MVIAAAVPTPTPELDDLSSPLTLVARTLDVLIGANERQQLETLGPQDVKIVIDMGDIGSASFDRIADAIPVLGRAATLAHRAELERYALPEADTAPGARRGRGRQWSRSPSRASPCRACSESTGIHATDAPPAAGRRGGQRADFEARQRGVRAVGLRDGRLQPDRRPGPPDPGPRTAREVLGAEHHSLRPRIDLGTGENTAFTIGGDFLRAWINQRGGEIHGSARVGRTSGLDLALYQPLDAAQRWFVEPGLTLQRSLEDIFADGESIARYRFSHGWGYLDAGRVFGNHTEMRAGLRSGGQSVSARSARPACPRFPARATAASRCASPVTPAIATSCGRTARC